MSWWRDDDVFRARSADTFDLRATDGPSTQSTGAHLSEDIEAGMWKRIRREGYFLDMLLSLHEPDMNPSSNYIHVQNPLTGSFFPLHRRRFRPFPKGFSLICWIPFASWRLLFWQVQKHTPVRPFSVQTTLCWVCNPPPAKKTPRRNLVRCATSLMTLIHMIMRILSVDFSFYTSAALRSSGVASHVNTCIPLRHPDSAACWC